MQKELHSRLPAGFDARLNLCQAYVAQLTELPLFGIDKRALMAPSSMIVNSLLIYSSRIEQDSEKLPLSLSLLLDEAGLKLAAIRAGVTSSPKNEFLGLAVEYGLRYYLAYKLKAHGELVHDRDNPLLIHALHPQRLTENVNVEMVQLLLENGADPNEKCVKIEDMYFLDEKIPLRIPIWHQFLYDLKWIPVTRAKSSMDLYDVLRLLITHGANPKEQVHTQTEFHRRRETGRAADLYKTETVIRKYENAEDIIRIHLSTEQLNRLLSMSRMKKERSINSLLRKWRQLL